MKALFPILFLWSTAIVACNGSDSTVNADRQEIGGHCDTLVQYAGESICLPIVSGWKEGIDNPRLENRRGALVDSSNITFAVYLSEKSWALGRELQNAVLNDYFKVYATKAGEKFKVKAEQLALFNKEFNGSAMRAQWSDIESYFKGKYTDVNLGQPVLMESHQPKMGIESNVYLIRGEIEGKEMFTLMTVSLCVVKERLLLVAHYIEYHGSASVSSAKSKSDYFTLRLLAENE